MSNIWSVLADLHGCKKAVPSGLARTVWHCVRVGGTLKKLIFAAVLAVSLPASAHHSINAQFDLSVRVTKEGVLTKFDNINPHTYWHFDVKGPDGKVSDWHIEGGAPKVFRDAGIRMKDDVKPGGTYKFEIAPSRLGNNTGLLMSIEIKGQTFKFGGM